MTTNVLQAAQERLAKIREMETIIQGAESEGRSVTDDENARLEDLAVQVDNMDRHIRTVDKVQRLRAAGGVPMNRRGAILPDLDESDFEIGMSKKDVANYRVGRAIFAVAEQLQGRGTFKDLAPMEYEASQAVQERFGREPRSFFMPYDVIKRGFGRLPAGAEKRADMTTGAGLGAELIETSLMAESFIDVLRNATVVGQAGATILTGLVGDIAIPRKTTGATVAWVTEGSAPSESSVAFDQVTMSPNSLAAVQDYTKKLLRQSSLDVEAMIRRELITSTAVEIDRVGLHGSGAGAEPQGIQGATGVAVVPAGAPDGGPLTEGLIVDLETEVSVDNAAMGRLGYVTNSAVRGFLKKTDIGTDTARRIWDRTTPDAPLNGYPAYITNNVRSDLTKGAGTNLSAVFFGDWTSLLIGQWGDIDILVDPFSQGVNGVVRVISFHEIDVDLRHGESFAVIVDANTA